MRIKLAFHLDKRDHLTVQAVANHGGPVGGVGTAAETRFDDADLFLKLIIFADLDEELTRRLVIAVILAVVNQEQLGEWIPAEITPEQNEILGLNLPFQIREPVQPRRRPSSLTLGKEIGAVSRGKRSQSTPKNDETLQ